MATTRECPFCGEPQDPGARFCSNCGNRYPFEDESETTVQPVAQPTPAPRRRSGAPWSRTLPLIAAVLLGAVVLGYGLFRFAFSYLDARRPEPDPSGPIVAASPAPASPSPVAVASPGAAASPSPVVISPAASPTVLGRVRVTNTDGQGANMRQQPSTTAPVVKSIPDDTILDVIGADRQAEGRTWRNVRDPDGATGWIAAELLAPA